MLARKLAVLALFAPTLGFAGDWGLGATVGDEGGTLYVPFQMNETLRLEPFVSFSRSEFDSVGGTITSTDLGVGAGLFRLYPINEQAHMSVGGRAGYFRDKISGGAVNGSTLDGLTAEAVLGGEAFLLPQFSLGVEGYVYVVDSDSGTGYGTGSRLIARVFFK